ncbi:unnamed protein product [Haemonchus placei]|uniref:QacE family quaternary ammonium compound efflux SMR transporter n=1 Tax=Haemonchus placei TaxID=6290 RepID=A0A0N4X2X9_HAEPC|nr:unnamed protein product [Haemonchus placei]
MFQLSSFAFSLGWLLIAGIVELILSRPPFGFHDAGKF